MSQKLSSDELNAIRALSGATASSATASGAVGGDAPSSNSPEKRKIDETTAADTGNSTSKRAKQGASSQADAPVTATAVQTTSSGRSYWPSFLGWSKRSEKNQPASAPQSNEGGVGDAATPQSAPESASATTAAPPPAAEDDAVRTGDCPD